MNWHSLLTPIAFNSKCNRNKVGAIIHKEGRIISTGWNGTPTGFDNSCEDNLNRTYGIVVHAEANAILFAAKHGTPLLGTSLVCSLSPCIECAKMIIQSGVTSVEYNTVYRDTAGIELLEKAGIKVKELSK